MTQIKVIIDLIALLIEGYKFISGQITEGKYLKAVKERKKNYEKYVKGSRKDRLEILKEENED